MNKLLLELTNEIGRHNAATQASKCLEALDRHLIWADKLRPESHEAMKALRAVVSSMQVDTNGLVHLVYEVTQSLARESFASHREREKLENRISFLEKELAAATPDPEN